MVSKITAMAMVAIIAVPILIGYGVNFQEYTDTSYTAAPATNVTDYLMTGMEYEYSNANTYQLNSNVISLDPSNSPPTVSDSGLRFYPKYKTFSAAASSVPMTYVNDGHTVTPFDLTTVTYYELVTSPNNGLSLTIENISNLHWTFNNVRFFQFIDGTANIYYMDSGQLKQTAGIPDIISVTYNSLSFTGTSFAQYQLKTANTSYANLANGWYAIGTDADRSGADGVYWNPGISFKDAIMTIDLDSLTANAYNWFTIIPRTAAIDSGSDAYDGQRMITFKYTGGTWHITELDPYSVDTPTTDLELVMGAAGTNVYQIIFTRTGYEVHMVGGWPSSFGPANTYRTWTADWIVNGSAAPIPDTHLFRMIRFSGFSTFSNQPLMRFDAATVLASKYAVIDNNTYSPASIIPSKYLETTVSNITKYGTSIQFGGNTYTVTDGNITVGTHSVSLSGISFRSLEKPDGTYDNQINGTTVSNTATPSTITFGGKWGAIVNTSSLTAETVTESKWVPGGFAFSDGVGFDFYLVGLLTSVVSFIALAMYGRKSGAKVGSLMLICGGAAFMFLLLM